MCIWRVWAHTEGNNTPLVRMYILVSYKSGQRSKGISTTVYSDKFEGSFCWCVYTQCEIMNEITIVVYL